MLSVSDAAARNDVYDLIELAFANRMDPAKLATIAEALEESIPRLDPARFRRELEHVVKGPQLPQLETAREMAQAVLEGRPVSGPTASSDAERAGRQNRGFLARAAGLLRGPPGRR